MRKIICDLCNEEIKGEANVHHIKIEYATITGYEKQSEDFESCATCVSKTKRFFENLGVTDKIEVGR